MLLFSFFFSFSNRVHLEQHTLVTEIRELVFPEDRTRYDELVYSRDPYLSDRERDRHRVSVFVFDKLFACKNMLPVRFLVNMYKYQHFFAFKLLHIVFYLILF